ncbi:MAG: FAD-dependent oxidoreductase [Dehalococcoidia bacterium]
MPKKVDAVVIGAGPAGSIAGAYLAKGGLKTVVFESTGVIGGMKYGSYTKGDFHDDLCSHLPLWAMGSNGGGGWWAKAATETGAALRWQCLPNTGIYNKGNNGKITQIPYCSNGEAYVNFLNDLSPMPLPDSTQKALARVFDEALAIPEEEIWWSEDSVTMPFATWVNKITDDEVAKQLLAVIAGLIMVCPAQFALQRASVQLFVGTYLAHLVAGRSNLVLPIGGTCDSLPKGFCNVTTKHGGQVLTNHKVSRVIVENGKVKGAVVHNADGREETYEAKYVVVASGYPSFKPLLGKNLPGEISEITKSFDTVHNTSLDVHFGLKRQVAPYPWWSQLMVLTEAFDYGCTIVVPSHFDPGTWCPEGKQLIQTCKFVDTAEYKKRPQKEWVQDLTDMTEWVFPGFKDEIEMIHVYEAAPSVTYFYLPVRKVPLECPGISGLYFAGDCTHAPGYTTERAASSAMMVAKTILRRGGN